MFQTKSQHTFYVRQLFPEDLIVYETVEPDRPRMTSSVHAGHLRLQKHTQIMQYKAYWLPTTTTTVLRTRLNVSLSC